MTAPRDFTSSASAAPRWPRWRRCSRRAAIDVQGSDHGVYPPMSDFLAREADPRVRRLSTPSTSPPTSTSSSSATRSRAATPSSKKCSTARSASCRCPRRFATSSSGTSRSIVIAGTHGKTTTTALTGWLLTAGGRDPSVLVGGIALNFDGSYRLGSRPRLRHRGRRVRQRVLRQDGEVPEVPAGHRRRRQPRVRPRRHLSGHGVAARSRSGASSIWCRGSGRADSRRRQSPRRCSSRRPRAATVETFGLAPDADWRASGLQPDGDRIVVRADASRGEPLGHVRAAALRRAQRPQRAGGDGGRRCGGPVGRRDDPRR